MEKLFDFISGICYSAKKTKTITDDFGIDRRTNASVNLLMPIEKLTLAMGVDLLDAIAPNPKLDAIAGNINLIISQPRKTPLSQGT